MQKIGIIFQIKLFLKLRIVESRFICFDKAKGKKGLFLL
jgi:hypothetical protein